MAVSFVAGSRSGGGETLETNPLPSERKARPVSVIVSGVGPMDSRHSNTNVHRLRDSTGSSIPRGSADLRGAAGAGRVDHDAAGDAPALGQRHAGDPRAVMLHGHRLVPREFDAEGTRLAPVCLEQRVRIDVSLPAVAQEAPAKPSAPSQG